jgi:predicted regulator of Ras-like GTPase activity (Roadblock/LC7/MglB family)
MLTSLFGDLGGPEGPTRTRRFDDDEPDTGFAATAILETVNTEVTSRGQIVDRHVTDLVVSGSAAQAIREHFATARADLDSAARMITLLDPAGVWAASVIKALSDATGRPIERILLRERDTLRTMATIERTTLLRRHDDPLKIYRADVRGPGRDREEIPMALAERSHLAAVVIGPMPPHAIDKLLEDLVVAAQQPTWSCPTLLFMLPPTAAWIASKINAVRWPTTLRVHLLDEPLVSASSVWNALLGIWNKIKKDAAAPALAGAEGDYPIKVAELRPEPARESTFGRLGADTGHGVLWSDSAKAPLAPPGVTVRPRLSSIEPARARQSLAGLIGLDGLLGCAVVDGRTGAVIAREQREDHPVDLESAAAAAAQVLRHQREFSRGMGLTPQLEETMITTGARQLLLRMVNRHPDTFVLALLDKHRANLALARFKLMDAERALT